jgi:hypothetical protein
MTTSKTICFCVSLSFGALSQAQMLTPVWTEVGENTTVARVVVSSANDCPSIDVDGAPHRMEVRLPVPEGFLPACELKISSAAKTAAVRGQPLHLPFANPSRIVVIGDTGCRVKAAKTVQDCNDPAKWPFARVAGSAAQSRPDLVVHVGDYLYREEPCPAEAQASCGGTPAGDRWEAWNVDFFAPAARLLAAAPWAFSRGNHEACDKSWRGWFYYLDPRPFVNKCEAFTAPYPVRLGEFSMVMFDSASTSDKELDPALIERYSAELAGIHEENAWLVLHHPLWGLKIAATAPPGTLPGESPTEVTRAWEKAPVSGIDFVVSGHTHLFELLSFDHGRPTQLVAGDGGTEMAVPLPSQLAGFKLRDATLLSGANVHEFGYTALTRSGSGWQIALTSTSGNVLQSATVPMSGLRAAQ